MHVKLLGCEALLAPTEEDRQRCTHELAAKSTELEDAKRLAEASLVEGAGEEGEGGGSGAGGMARTIVADCVALLGHIAAAQAKIAESSAAAASTPAATATSLRTPDVPTPLTPATSSVASIASSLSTDAQALRDRLEALRAANLALSTDYDAVKAQLADRAQAARRHAADAADAAVAADASRAEADAWEAKVGGVVVVGGWSGSMLWCGFLHLLHLHLYACVRV